MLRLSCKALGAAGLLAFFAASGLRAELTWANREVQYEAKLDEESIRLVFAFTNATRQPVTLTEIETSCGCTAATSAKKIYAPGEQGQIDVIFDAKGTAGVQQKTIYVRTSDAAEATALTFKVNVPAWLEITPRLIWWRTGDKNSPKDSIATLTEPAKIKLTAASVDGDAFTATIVPEPDGRRYRIVVQPVATTGPAQATVTVVAELAGGESRKYVLFAQVR